MTLVLPSVTEIWRSTDGVGAGPGGGVGGGGGGGVPGFSLTNLETALVCNVNKSIAPEADRWRRGFHRGQPERAIARVVLLDYTEGIVEAILQANTVGRSQASP